MPNEKVLKLIEALDSFGYRTVKLNCLYETEYRYGDIELLLFPISRINGPFLKEKMMRLVEILDAAGFGIIKYNSLCRNKARNSPFGRDTDGDFELVLYSLEETNVKEK